MAVTVEGAVSLAGSDDRKLWALCAAAAIVAHLAIALWLLPSSRTLELTEPPPALLIDLTQPSEEPAPAPPAIASEPPRPAPPQAAPPLAPAIPEPPKPAPPPPPAPVPATPPLPPVTPLAPPEVVLPPSADATPETPAPPVPREKPRPPERRRPDPPREVVKRVTPAPTSPPATLAEPAPAPAAAPPAPAKTAPAAPSASSVAAAKTWQGEVLAQLARNKRYPVEARSNHEQGTAFLRFTLDHEGRVVSFNLEKSSGSQALDEETLALIQRAQPLPPAPPEMTQSRIELIVPVDFHLRS